MTGKIQRIGGFTQVESLTPTIETDAYVAGDLIGTKLSFANAVRGVGGGSNETGLLQSVIITDLAKQSANLDVVFFDTNPSNTTFTDNAAFDPHDTDLLTIIVVVAVTDWKDFNDNSIGQTLNLAIPFDLGGDTTLYAAIVSRGTPTYASTSDLTVRVGILAD